MLPLINPLPVLISIAALFGVFVHDSQLGSVAMAAMSMPVITSDVSGHNQGNMEYDLSPKYQHIHAEAGSLLSSAHSLRTQQPAAQPRTENDKKYISQKRFKSNNVDNDYYWPSI